MTAVNRTIVVHYSGREIKVTNHWFGGAKLYVDGNCRAHTRQPFALNKKKPRLTATFEENGQQHSIEVFAWAPIWKVHLKICVDGDRLGGDDF